MKNTDASQLAKAVNVALNYGPNGHFQLRLKKNIYIDLHSRQFKHSKNIAESACMQG